MSEADENEARDIKLVDAAMIRLSEHFDSVQIFVTKVIEDGQTAAVQKGCGNWYARRGQVQEWVAKEDEGSRDAVRS